MKAVIVLLAAAAAAAVVYGIPHSNLVFITSDLQCLHKKALDMEFDSVFVKDLKTHSCEPEFFCQAEKLLTGVKKLFKEDRTCNVDKLLRNLKQYTNGVNCTVPAKGDEIILHSFLIVLKNCAKKVYSRS